MTEPRKRLPATRRGTVTKYTVGPCSLYVTVNGRPPVEVFAKADEGHQAEADGLAGLASIAMQGGPVDEVRERVIRFLRHRRYAPHGGPGHPCSISDAIGRALEAAEGRGNKEANRKESE